MELYNELLKRQPPKYPDWEAYWSLVVSLPSESVEVMYALVLEFCSRTSTDIKSLITQKKKYPPFLMITKAPEELQKVIVAYLNQVPEP